MIKVLSFPNPHDGLIVSGITTVVKKYYAIAQKCSIEFVTGEDKEYDLVAVHAGMAQPAIDIPMVAHCHGLYWTAHYDANEWESQANKYVMGNVRRADVTTVPSEWVAETFQRDMHMDPIILPHGVDTDEWTPINKPMDYVLWNKNRDSDVCTTEFIQELARLRPDRQFISTFGTNTENFHTIGTKLYEEMREIVRMSGVYVNTTEETFGIGILEAMASGKPILAFNNGGAAELVEHGVNGYLARVGDTEDLANGLDWCFKHRKILGENSREISLEWSWDSVGERLFKIYEYAIGVHNRPKDVSVIIPCYNKQETLKRAVDSVLAQTRPASEIIIVDNNSTDLSRDLAQQLSREHDTVSYTNAHEQGVAHARNRGLFIATSNYVACLDADDEIKPDFLKICCAELDKPNGADLAYTGLEVVKEDGSTSLSEWPGPYDPVAFYNERNQVPTCCVFRTKIALRLGGFRQRYAPDGAGAEDAEFWLRMLKHGYIGKKVIRDGLFRYHIGGTVGGNPEYREVDWKYFHRDLGISGVPLGSGALFDAPVQKYNEPIVSVIIPCTDNHIQYLWDVLDSLESQTFPFWEAIVVMDGKYDMDKMAILKAAFPFIKLNFTEGENGGGKGAGAARNAGVSIARGQFILYCDADDWLVPTCIEEMLRTANENPGSIIYSDYIGRAFGVTDPEQFERNGRLIHYDPSDQFAIIRYKAFEYDCETAQRQPEIDSNGEFYIWNLVTSLVPIELHKKIGGFDEVMESWEDWDYWIRMARYGFCFIRLPEELVSYRFYTGSRREIGRQLAGKLLDYLRTKYEGEPKMACGGCGRKRSAPVAIPDNNPPIAAYSSNDMVRVRFIKETFGEPISIRDQDTNQLHDYGFRKGGDIFMMLRKHAEMQPNRYEILPSEPVPVVKPEPQMEQEAPKPIAQPEPEPESVAEVEPEPEIKEEPEPPKPKTTRRRRRRASSTSSSTKKSS